MVTRKDGKRRLPPRTKAQESSVGWPAIIVPAATDGSAATDGVPVQGPEDRIVYGVLSAPDEPRSQNSLFIREGQTRPWVFTVAQTAELLGLGRNQTYEAVQRGDIPSIRIGKRILVPRIALEAMLAGRDPV
jgi:excisionase family DNA binding protein